MNILYLITGLGGGGAEKVVVDLADQMYERGHNVKIAYLKGSVVVQPKNIEIELIYLGLENLTKCKSAYNNYKKLILDFKPDVVHAHMVHANIFARISRKFLSVPRLICSAHSNNEGGRFRMLAYKYTHNFADITTNVSKNASLSFEKLGAVPENGITTVYNGIDLSKFEKNNKDDCLKNEINVLESTPLFLSVGRFHEAKDYPNLLRAFSIFKETFTFKEKQPKLAIAGDGELRREIEALINTLNLQSNVILLGRRDDVPALLNISDFFVLSSKYEGLPTVIIEAMACETYVIATDCGGSHEIMGETGTLVPIQNSSALAEAFKNVLELNESEIVNNNKIARKRIEDQFSLISSVEKWLKLYEF
ncbi:Glycosyl transferase, group 1 [Acinetobacter bereziniae]|uniref:glycosyltransferase n=1 Tax=Acinetobacter bereziniae TaxID=106648 RepID=UPI000573A33D|nr:glycosyltransferase [Acinetobacter bereziniae]CEI53782.1 Glycosyl transferase, group 1 [Acinetobacter bereziniae]